MSLSPKHFIQAIKSKNPKAVHICIASGLYDEYDLRQALAFSAFSGFDEGATLLLSHAQTERKDFVHNELDRCIDLSATRGHASTMRIFESAGADPNHEDDFPFYLSVGRGHVCSSLYLLLRGAQDQNVEYALKTAYKRGHQDLAKTCVKLKNIANTPEYALFEAIRKDDRELARAALLAGADPNENQAALLYMACREKRTAIMLLMAAAGGNPLLRGSKEWLEAARASADLRNMEAAKSIYQRAMLGGKMMGQLPKKKIETWKGRVPNFTEQEGKMPEGFKKATKQFGDSVGQLSRIAIEKAPMKTPDVKKALTRVMPKRAEFVAQEQEKEISSPPPAFIEAQSLSTKVPSASQSEAELAKSQVVELNTEDESKSCVLDSASMDELPDINVAIPMADKPKFTVRPNRIGGFLMRQAIVSAEAEANKNDLDKDRADNAERLSDMSESIKRQAFLLKTSVEEKDESIPVLTDAVLEPALAKSGPTARGIRKASGRSVSMISS